MKNCKRMLVSLATMAVVLILPSIASAQEPPGGSQIYTTGVTITDMTCNSPSCTVTVDYDCSIAAGKSAYVTAYIYRRHWNGMSGIYAGPEGWECVGYPQHISGSSGTGSLYEDETYTFTPPCAMLSYGVKLVVEIEDESGPYPSDVGAVMPACSDDHVWELNGKASIHYGAEVEHLLDSLCPEIEVVTAEFGLCNIVFETRIINIEEDPEMLMWPDSGWVTWTVWPEYCDEDECTFSIFQTESVAWDDLQYMYYANQDTVRQEVDYEVMPTYSVVPESKWYSDNHGVQHWSCEYDIAWWYGQ